jgi:DHA1 family tetracycline resistance protein-like MFS transporter
MTVARKTMRSLLPLIFLNQTALTITFPLVTLIFFDHQSRLFASDLSTATRSMWYGLCVALPNVINLFFAPYLSILSDEVGRKRILMIEIGSAALFTALVGFGIYLGNMGFVFAGFIVKGAFSRSNPTALAIVADSTPSTKKILYMGYLQFAISVGAALGPIVGGYCATLYFTQLNFAAAFIVAAIIALISTQLAHVLLQETLINKTISNKARFDWTGLVQCCQQKSVQRIALILILTQISWSAYYQFIPPILKTQQHFNSHQLGWFIGIIAIWLAFASGPLLAFLHYLLSTQKLLIVSLYFLLAGIFLTLMTQLGWLPEQMVWFAALPVAAGDVIAYSCLIAFFSNLTPHQHQGKIMGLAFLIVGLTWSFTSFCGGFLMGYHTLLPLMLAPSGILAAIILIHTQFGKKIALDTESAFANQPG